MDLTTLQIAERIADAAIHAHHHGDETPIDAVLRTLRENGVWLHRVVQDADGVIDGDAPTEVLPEVEA